MTSEPEHDMPMDEEEKMDDRTPEPAGDVESDDDEDAVEGQSQPRY